MDESNRAAADEATAANRIKILGVWVNCLSAQEAARQIELKIKEGGSHPVYIANAHTLRLASEDASYRAVLNAATLVLNDGTGVSWAAKRQGISFQDNLVGTDFVPYLCRTLKGSRYRFFLLGSRPGVAQAASQILQSQCPQLEFIGSHHGYFAPEENDELIARMREMHPDVILVGMGNPLQEQWLHEHLASTGAAVGIGVGALFDYVSGSMKRAPQWMLDRGMEWVWRLLLEPKRLWQRYLFGNPLFVYRVLKQQWGMLKLD
jgi:exopolysaccharide biosynthesis WecB/TagA/CpsF family protein